MTHIFEKKDELDPTFYRQRHINEMLNLVETKVTANYDCDVLLPFDTYLDSQRFIVEEAYDVIYPYGQGPWQKKVYATDEMVSEFSQMTVSSLRRKRLIMQRVDMSSSLEPQHTVKVVWRTRTWNLCS